MPTPQIQDRLLRLQMGEAASFKNLSLFPLLNGTSGSPDYLTLEEALQADLVSVTELHEGGEVNQLKVTNRASQAVLIVDGEELVGAKQNRVVNLTILVPPEQTIVIPVTCVEQGRWHHVSREFRTSRQTMAAMIRARKSRQVYYRRETVGDAAADQAALWEDIATLSMNMQVHSPTGAMSDIYEHYEPTLHDYERALQPLEAQVGVLFAINGQIVSLDVFDYAATFARFFPKLLRSVALDAIAYFQPQFAPLSHEAAQEFIQRVAHADARGFPTVGEGEDVRLRAAGVIGSALVARERVVHLCAFAVPDSPDASDERTYELFTSLSRPSARLRRQLW
ncbi:MAG: hypothetical protein NZ520_01000 [bacterium]|nr:hypothetical protein [bacterium]